MKKNLLLFLLFFSICTIANAQLSIFADNYGAGITFTDFGSSTNVVSIDNTVAHSGTSSFKAVVPSSGYTGGTFKAAAPTNLSTYNAVSFWVKADAAKTLNVSGISDNSPVTTFQAEYNSLPVSSTWTKYIIPIPAPGKLTAEEGLFHFAEGADEGAYTLWFDDIQYENSAAIGAFSPAITTQTLSPLVGGTFTPTGQTLSVLVNGVPQTILVRLACFDFMSSNTSVATIVNGTGTAVGAGTAVITGTLNGVAATGTITVNVSGAASAPTIAAPTPMRLPANVISMFSNAYTDVAGTDWNPNWGQSTVVTDVAIIGNATKKYANFNYQGISFTPAIDASAMEFVHFDIWTPAAMTFELFLISPGPVEKPFAVNPTPGVWNSFDIPLTAYNPPVALNNIFQIKLVGNPASGTVYMDNLYFYKNPPGSGPLTAAPVPTRLPANVISLFSNTYTNIAGTDWNPSWGQTTVVSDVTITGNDTKKYANLNYQGITLGSAIDVSAMDFVHFDIWTPAALAFELFLINPGPVEKPFLVNPTPGVWNSYDVPLSAFNPPVALNNIFQIKLVGTPSSGTVYMDNLYFYKNPVVFTTPMTAAPTPTRLPAYVSSLFSNAYTNVAGTDWNPNWGQSTVVTDVQIAGNDTKKYATMNYQGVQFAAPLNVANMEFLHFDLWTPNATAFDFFLINPGPVEKAVTKNPTAGVWNSYDIPLSSYSPINLANIIQFKLVGTPFGTSTVWLDNIYFYRNPAVAPVVAAPTPTRLPAFVKSLFSDAYTNVAGTDWNPNWGQSTVVTDVTLAGNNTKKYATLNYQGVQFNPSIDATGMEFLHFDLWTPNCTAFNMSLINPGPIEKAVTVNPTLSGWNSFDIPLTSYNTINLANIIQLKLEGTPFGTSTVWLDNVYFYKNPPTVPIAAAPTPTHPAVNVLSLFSDAYTNVAGTDWFPNWGQSTVVADISISGNTTKKYTSLNYQGVQFAAAINASGMEFLHLDLWTGTCTAFDVFLINTGPVVEQKVTLTPTAFGWNSFDIPLSSYNLIALNKITQFKLVGMPAGCSLYLDNIYFYNTPTLTLSSNNLTIAAPANSTKTFKITSNTTWTASSNQTWLKVEATSGTGTADITLTAEANTSTSATRTAIVTISGSGFTSKTVTVVQDKEGLFLNVSSNTLTVDALGTSLPFFEITSNTSWTISIDSTWLIIPNNTYTGSGNRQIIMTAKANPYITTRTTFVTVSAAGIADQKILVIQGAAAPNVSVSANNLTIAAPANSKKAFDVASNTSWAISSSETWLVADKLIGSNNATVTLTAEANLSTSTRTATITVTSAGLTPKTITVTQDGVPVVLAVTTNTLSIAAPANSTKTFDITSNTNWTISSSETWLTPNSLSGAANASITITAEANPSPTIRTATITVSAAGIASQIITVNQDAAGTILTISSTALSIAAPANSTKTFDITANLAWTLVSSETWLVADKLIGSNNATITLTAEENLSTNPRTATITISGPNVGNQVIIVTQEGAVPVLNVSLNDITIEALANSTKSFDITSNTDWTITSNQGWLKVDTTGGKANAKIILTAAENANTAIRKAIVTVTSAGAPIQTINVTQEAAAAVLGISATTLTIAAPANSTATFKISSNTSWSISSSQPTWLKSGASGGFGSTDVVLTAQENSGVTTRVAIITITPKGLPDQTVTVTQEAGAAILTVSTTALTIGAVANSTKTFDITSNTDWTISSSETWLVPNQLTGTGKDTITLTAQANPLNAVRTATVTIKAAGVADKTIIVTQDFISGVNNIDNEKIAFSLYPNPVTDNLFIKLLNPNNALYGLTINGLDGKMIMKLNNFDTQRSIDVSMLPEGVYFIQLMDKETKGISTRKFVKL